MWVAPEKSDLQCFDSLTQYYIIKEPMCWLTAVTQALPESRA